MPNFYTFFKNCGTLTVHIFNSNIIYYKENVYKACFSEVLNPRVPQNTLGNAGFEHRVRIDSKAPNYEEINSNIEIIFDKNIPSMVSEICYKWWIWCCVFLF